MQTKKAATRRSNSVYAQEYNGMLGGGEPGADAVTVCWIVIGRCPNRYQCGGVEVRRLKFEAVFYRS
jgi:hypothetical protein